MVMIGPGSASEREVLLDAIGVGRIDRSVAAQAAPALGRLALAEVAAAGAGAQNLAVGGDLKSFGGRLLRLDAFWTSHKYIQLSLKKERAI